MRKLYWGSGSYWAWKVQLVLAEKGLDCEYKLCSFEKREHKSEEIMALNPRGQVPTFIDDDIVICDSGAACLYLEMTYPTLPDKAKLLPDEPKLKAAVLQYFFEANNLFTVHRAMTNHLQKPELPEKKADIKKELSIWEGHLQGISSFMVGDSMTLADISFYPFLATEVRYGLDLNKAGFPALAKYHALMAGIEIVKRTTPPHWAEGPMSNPVLADL